MDVLVKAKCEVPARIRQEARRRVEHAARFVPQMTTVEVTFGHEPNPRIADPACIDVSARTQGGRIRVQGRGSDHRAALDVAVTRFERQLARSTARATARARRTRTRARRPGMVLALPALAPVRDGTAERRPRFVKHSRFQAAVMLPEEAAAQLELLGHDVFVFTNRTTGAYGVVYRRREGGLVLLEPEQAHNGSG